MVALRKESVDRNLQKLAEAIKPSVALRKESVDRNIHSLNLPSRPIDVALRKESVDRNSIGRASFRAFTVALRKESVDRNYSQQGHFPKNPQSLSARRAWIEIRIDPDQVPG